MGAAIFKGSDTVAPPDHQYSPLGAAICHVQTDDLAIC